MDFERLTESIDKLLKKLQEAETQVNYLRQRESKLLESNESLQEQIKQAQTKIETIIDRLKSVEEHA